MANVTFAFESSVHCIARLPNGKAVAIILDTTGELHTVGNKKIRKGIKIFDSKIPGLNGKYPSLEAAKEAIVDAAAKL